MTALVFAVATATFPLPAQTTWIERAENGFCIAFVAFSFVLVLATLRRFYLYKHSGYQNGAWIATVLTAGNAVTFELSLRQYAVPATFLDHGLMLCVVRFPDGHIHGFSDLNRELIPRGSARVLAVSPQPAQPDDYDIRWYGSRTAGRYYEITRLKVTL